MTAWFSRTTFEVPCTVDIEHTPESLHAYVELDGCEIEPGDTVLVHGAPTHVPFGEKLTARCRAQVTRANRFDQAITKIGAYLELTELYEVGFSDGRAS